MKGLFIGRYELLEQLEPGVEDRAVATWRAHDSVLDRLVSLRLLDATDTRAAAFLGAAQAAARVEDRRLVRVLDIFQTSHDGHDYVAVISEWATGRSLVDLIADGPVKADEAVELITEVARGVSAGLATHVSHGRLRPTSVFVTDAGEVRVRGLATDAALWGVLDPSVSKQAADVDGCGSLLYLLVTGTWPGPPLDNIEPAPRAGAHVLAPSRVRASVPRSIDDVIARSVQSVQRPRGLLNVTDIDGFASILGNARGQVTPIAPGTSAVQRQRRIWQPIVAVLAAIVVVITLGFVGLRLLSFGGSAATQESLTIDTGILTESIAPTTISAPTGQIWPIASVRSYDPFGDDNSNGRPDKRRGKENDDEAVNAIDANPESGWQTAKYRTPDLDGKGGVGIVFDLGEPRPIQSAMLSFDGVGTSAQIRVSNDIQPDSALWSAVASVDGAGEQIEIRSPRPVTGRYVLVWFTNLPASGSGYQGGLKGVTFRS